MVQTGIVLYSPKYNYEKPVEMNMKSSHWSSLQLILARGYSIVYENIAKEKVLK